MESAAQPVDPATSARPHTWRRRSFVVLNDPRPDPEDPIVPGHPERGCRPFGLYHKYICTRCGVTGKVYGGESPRKDKNDDVIEVKRVIGGLGKPYATINKKDRDTRDWDWTKVRIRRDEKFAGEDFRFCPDAIDDKTARRMAALLPLLPDDSLAPPGIDDDEEEREDGR